MDVSRGIFTRDSRKACTLDGSASGFAVVCRGRRCCAWHCVVVRSKAGAEATFWFYSVPSPASKPRNWLAPFARHKSSINEQEPGTAYAFYVSFVNLTTSRELWGDFCSFGVNKACWGWNHSHQFQLEACASLSFSKEYESFWPGLSTRQQRLMVAPSFPAL